MVSFLDRLIARACVRWQVWIYRQEPWKIPKGADQAEKAGPIMRAAVDAIYILAHFFECLIPDAVAAIEVG